MLLCQAHKRHWASPPERARDCAHRLTPDTPGSPAEWEETSSQNHAKGPLPGREHLFARVKTSTPFPFSCQSGHENGKGKICVGASPMPSRKAPPDEEANNEEDDTCGDTRAVALCSLCRTQRHLRLPVGGSRRESSALPGGSA